MWSSSFLTASFRSPALLIVSSSFAVYGLDIIRDRLRVNGNFMPSGTMLDCTSGECRALEGGEVMLGWFWRVGIVSSWDCYWGDAQNVGELITFILENIIFSWRSIESLLVRFTFLGISCFLIYAFFTLLETSIVAGFIFGYSCKIFSLH